MRSSLRARLGGARVGDDGAASSAGHFFPPVAASGSDQGLRLGEEQDRIWQSNRVRGKRVDRAMLDRVGVKPVPSATDEQPMA